MDELFSPMENQILKIVGKRRISISDITEKYIEKFESNALRPNIVISGAIKNINKKCKRHKLKWYLNGCGGGRSGKIVWKDF